MAANIQTDLVGIDKSVDWVAGPSTSAKTIGYDLNGTQTLVLSVKSTDGTCYFTMIDNTPSTGGTFYGKIAAAASCDPASPPTGVPGMSATSNDVGWG